MDAEIMPCLSFPTTLVFVDDDPKFLDHMAIMLGEDHLVHLFKDPKTALKFLKETYKFDPFTNRCQVEVDDIFPDHRVLDFNIRLIQEEAFNPNRFKEIGIIILDYAMPDMTGGELAEQLKRKPYKIILLTGEASAQTAVKLFNDGVIHSYIRKDDQNFKELLIQSIKNLQNQYFQDLSRVVLDNYPDRNWPKDPVYKELFNKIRMENNIAEFFLLDEFGSCLFLTNEGQASFLAVANEDMMDTYTIVIKDFNLPANIVAGINNKTLMPFFLNDEDFNLAPSEWVPYIHPVSVLQGFEKYYYSYITKPDPNIYKFKNKIVSYSEFLASQD
ncbi:hypothetical protein BH10PSE19_BH10PSE19_02890 [soil metagenome]